MGPLASPRERKCEMTETTYRTICTEHLGSDATEDDLDAFVAACEHRQARTGEDDATVTEAIWNDGAFLEAIAAELPNA